MASFLLGCLGLLPVTAVAAENPLGFLRQQDADHAWVIDSGFDPGAFYGLSLDPPWVGGGNALTRIGLGEGAPRILSTTPLGADGAAMSLALSPDGDTALVSTLRPSQVLVVRGLRRGAPRVTAALPLERFPLSFGFAPDGRWAAVGLQLDGPGTAQVALLGGLPEAPALGRVVDLGVRADVLSAVESVDVSRDGGRLLVQTGLHRHPDPPLFFLPDIALQVVDLRRANASASDPLILPAEPTLPPEPAFEGLQTGRALGDSVILCDGDTAVVGSTGAINLGQPDARLIFVGGVLSDDLRVERVLTPADGVGIGPFQVALGPDCAAWVSNTVESSVTRIDGLLAGDLDGLELTTHPIGGVAAAEPAVTPDGGTVLVHRPRAPRDGAPPATVAVIDAGTGEPLGPPLAGPLAAWIEVKDSTLATHPPGLVDHLHALAEPSNASELGRLVALVERAAERAAADDPAAAREGLLSFSSKVEDLRLRGTIGRVEARLFHDLAATALAVLEK